MRKFFIVIIMINWSIAPVLSNENLQTEQALELLKSIEVLNISKPEESQSLIVKAAENTLIQNSDYLKSYFYNVIAHKAILSGNFVEATENLELAKNLASSSGNVLQQSEALRREAGMLTILDQYSNALALLNEALLLHNHFESNRKVYVLEGMLNIYNRLENYDRVLEYGYLFLEEATKINESSAISSAHLFLYLAYLNKDELENAKYHIRELVEAATTEQIMVSFAYDALASFNLANNNPEEAYENIQIAKQQALKSELVLHLPFIMLREGEILYEIERINEAKTIYESIIVFANEKGFIEAQLDAMQKLADIYKQENDFEQAFLYIEQYNDTKERLRRNNERQLLSVNQAKLEVTSKENQIDALLFEQKLNEQMRQNQQIIILIFIACLIVLAVFTVITFKQKRKLTQTLEQLEKASSAKSQFLSRMSHEIRTPINAIIGLTKLSLKSILKPNDTINLQQIEESSQTLLGVINDVLDYSKIEAGELHLSSVSFNIEEIVSRALRIIEIPANEKSITLSHSIERNVPTIVKGDPLRLTQVLNNLLGNAIKFTESGKISVKVEKHNIDNLHLLKFSITDTGIGFEHSKVHKIFDSFSQADESITREYGGTGLGLAISKQLVELMGGEIWVTSTQNVQTTFCFTIKVADAPRLHTTTFEAKELSNIKTLIIDDLAISRQSIVDTLANFDIQSDCANNGNSGIKAFKNAIEQNQPYDLIIIDWQMPDIDGLDVAKTILQEVTEKVPFIIMVSNIDLVKLKALCKPLNIESVLEKPINEQALLSAISKQVQKNQVKALSLSSIENDIPDFSHLHILLVEDNKINRKVACAYLAETNATISIAKNGQEAIELFCENAQIDLVLMDLQMPIMDGYTATQKIRQEFKSNIPIVAMTAYVLIEEVKKCLDVGMNAHVSKPILASNLYTVIHENTRDVHKPLKVTSVNQVPLINKKELTKHSTAKTDLVLIEETIALAALFNNKSAYLELIEDFISLAKQMTIIENVDTSESLKINLSRIHSLTPSLAYIGAFNLSEFAANLEQQLREQNIPISSDMHHATTLFKNTLEGIVEKLIHKVNR